MELRVISDYGSVERIVTPNATAEAISELMASLDWYGFHQVVLTRPNGDWLEVGGSLDPTDGLSVMFEEDGEQHVIEEPPASVEGMTSFLLGYLSGGDEWKAGGQWT